MSWSLGTYSRQRLVLRQNRARGQTQKDVLSDKASAETLTQLAPQVTVVLP